MRNLYALQHRFSELSPPPVEDVLTFAAVVGIWVAVGTAAYRILKG